MDLFERKASSYIVDSAYRTFFRMLPGVPLGRTLFTPRSDVINFTNGTLHLIKEAGLKMRKEFRPHNPDDFIVNQLPLAYDPSDTAIHCDVTAIFDRIFADDSDKPEKIRAVKQMFGFTLAPLFPHIVLLIGKPGSGKSTLLDLAVALVGEQNRGNVGPEEMGNRFALWRLVGKLVNVVYDVNTDRPIADDKVKMIRDHAVLDIERKGIAHVQGKIPAAHIWAGNDVPPTHDKSGAHEKRWTFIVMNAKLRTGQENLDFAKDIISLHLRSILNLALQGLDDLIDSRGHFIQPSSGVQVMEQFLESADDLGTEFLKAVDAGEITVDNSPVRRDDGLRIDRAKLFTACAAWIPKAHIGAVYYTRKKFYAACRAAGLTEVKGHDSRDLVGIGIDRGPNPAGAALEAGPI
jgi:phage/plasmid-associated DNA primase